VCSSALFCGTEADTASSMCVFGPLHWTFKFGVGSLGFRHLVNIYFFSYNKTRTVQGNNKIYSYPFI
jgi:hypothetical protein